MRHRKWYRIAFLQVTNDKKHYCWSSQPFVSHRLEFYDIFHKKGLDEDLKFAWNDEAETARKEAALMAENTRSISVAVGTTVSGASIQGQSAAAVVTALRDARDPPDQQPRHKRCLGRFGTVPGSMSCVEKNFELKTRKWEEYKGTRYYDGDKVLVFELWLHRVGDDLSGLTFQEWDPSAGTEDASDLVTMVVNSSELRVTDFHLVEVRSLQLDTVSRGDRRTCGVVVRKLQGVGNSTFVLSVENDNDFRSRCE